MRAQRRQPDGVLWWYTHNMSVACRREWRELLARQLGPFNRILEDIDGVLFRRVQRAAAGDGDPFRPHVMDPQCLVSRLGRCGARHTPPCKAAHASYARGGIR